MKNISRIFGKDVLVGDAIRTTRSGKAFSPIVSIESNGPTSRLATTSDGVSRTLHNGSDVEIVRSPTNIMNDKVNAIAKSWYLKNKRLKEKIKAVADLQKEIAETEKHMVNLEKETEQFFKEYPNQHSFTYVFDGNNILEVSKVGYHFSVSQVRVLNVY